jgi:hypothetical protein
MRECDGKSICSFISLCWTVRLVSFWGQNGSKLLFGPFDTFGQQRALIAVVQADRRFTR